MILAPDLSALGHAAKDALILALLDRLNALEERVASLEKEVVTPRAENAALRTKLGLPPKTPDNSSTPPSQGHKPSAQAAPKNKGNRKSRPGKHRPPHPNPSKKLSIPAAHCEHCAVDVSGEPRMARETYDCPNLYPGCIGLIGLWFPEKR